MKRKLLFILFILCYTTVEGQNDPPPPPGLNSLIVCDVNNDGIEQFDLASYYAFAFYERVFGQVPEDYHPTMFYLTKEDMDNEVNPIVNSSAYQNITSPQRIYYRANAISSDGAYEYLTRDDEIGVIAVPVANYPKPLIGCDDSGSTEFNLASKNNEILGDQTGLVISYHSIMVDAENATNQLSQSSYYNTSNPQVIYVRVENSETGCYSITFLKLKVLESSCYDVAVYLISLESPRRGFEYINTIYIKNMGAEPIALGEVEFTHDSRLIFNNVSNLDVGNSVATTSTGFILEFVNLEQNETHSVEVSMTAPLATINLGNIITNSVKYLGTDFVVENNISELSEVVIGSYDPNDIMESHGTDILFDEFTTEDYLYYTIRFQNVGTADAINVAVENSLNDQLDLSSFELLTVSHDYSITQTGNKLKWQFDDIHLPSEDMDEPASHGYIYYKIKPKSGYAVGDIIPNRAEIYFDFNEAVITNTFETEFTALLSNGSNFYSELIIYPNPAKDFVNIKLNKNSENILDIKVYDIQGKLILNDHIENNARTLNVSKLSNGIYFLKIENGNNTVAKRLIIE